MSNNGNGNTNVIFFIGMILSFLLVMFLLFNRQIVQPQVIQQPEVIQVQPAIPAPPTPQQPAPTVIGQPYPRTYPEYHNNNVFWEGYSDGWNGWAPRSEGRVYLQGFEIGRHDRACHHAYYHERYCPPGFSLRLPGLHINVR